MSNLWMAISPGPTATRVIAMAGASETILKARLLRGATQLEGLRITIIAGRVASDGKRDRDPTRHRPRGGARPVHADQNGKSSAPAGPMLVGRAPWSTASAW